MPRMDAQSYERLAAPLRSRPGLCRAVVGANKALTLVGYVTYPLLLILLIVKGDRFLVTALLVPAVLFVLLSLVRAKLNRPRPYEELDITPLIDKKTKGHSMPSRHTFSLMVIAFMWLLWFPPVGIVLVVLAACLGALRVVCGVHYPRDVIAGTLVAVLGLVIAVLLPF